MKDERPAFSTLTLAAPAERVFKLLDDPAALGAYMKKPSAMLFGGSMTYEMDRTKG